MQCFVSCHRVSKASVCRKYYGARIFENSHESSLPSGLNERSQLAELARTLLVDGGFNEVVYVAVYQHIILDTKTCIFSKPFYFV